MSGRLPVPAHEGAGLCGVAAGVVGLVGITRTWGHSPGVGAFYAVGDISARPGTFLRARGPESCPRTRRVSPSAAVCTRPRGMSPSVFEGGGGLR